MISVTLSDLPHEVIQKIIDLLPRDILLELLHFKNNWAISHAFCAYYQKISIQSRIPNQSSNSYSNDIVNPFELNFGEYAVLGSRQSLINFLNSYPNFIPDEISFDNLDDLIAMHQTHDTLLTRVKRVRICEEKYDGEHSPHWFKMKQVQRYPYNIYSQQYKHDTVLCQCDDVQFQPSIQHLEIPQAKVMDSAVFFARLKNLRSFSSNELLHYNIEYLPKRLNYVSLLSSAILHLPTYDLELPPQVKQLQVRSLLPLDTYLNIRPSGSLTEIEFKGGKFKDMGYFRFPEHLTTLVFRDCEIDSFLDFNTSNKFSCLTALHISGYFGKLFYYYFFNTALPQSLTDLSFRNCKPSFQRGSTNDTVVYRYPESFTDFGFFKLNDSFELPKNLKKLYLKCPGVMIEPSWKLPKSLQSVELLDFTGTFKMPDLAMIQDYKIGHIKLEFT
ncbi:uncharacterized protein SPAPADRAFT_68961 [Spathaspora passalidarum NRRL Y-27907]|uniref:F-box domain-containing protein n=1 Tax=Spathaspora passalidarum (strain NRRL Y-27907 / 11-Y1) TaxID=619300 RepID=G3AVC1_SPAPN|nr:uncharacterized protein SPAPADRAFT_68961 [Spathaspora passalidarum NRRL Y-27907]EGW30140.1 hypothetical protein SPAPADRAFT_68961 [Spathaspora passalidarum NRRL Y-27907]